MTDVNTAVNNGIEKIINDFQIHPQNYFTEEDIRWRLLREIENILDTRGLDKIDYSGEATSRIHTEYPTPFRCSMNQRQFEVLNPENKKGQRGHFDIVLLNTNAAKNCEFEILRSQYYTKFCEELGANRISLPFLDYAIELKLFRDLAHPNRTESAKQQAEYAVQAIRKLEATVKPNEYYPEPFAKRGIVLLFDNSELVNDIFKVEAARKIFFEEFAKLQWELLPDTLSCIWVSPKCRLDYQGRAIK